MINTTATSNTLLSVVRSLTSDGLSYTSKEDERTAEIAGALHDCLRIFLRVEERWCMLRSVKLCFEEDRSRKCFGKKWKIDEQTETDCVCCVL